MYDAFVLIEELMKRSWNLKLPFIINPIFIQFKYPQRMEVARCILLLLQLFLHFLFTYINLLYLLSLNQPFSCFFQLVLPFHFWLTKTLKIKIKRQHVMNYCLVYTTSIHPACKTFKTIAMHYEKQYIIHHKQDLKRKHSTHNANIIFTMTVIEASTILSSYNKN